MLYKSIYKHEGLSCLVCEFFSRLKKYADVTVCMYSVCRRKRHSMSCLACARVNQTSEAGMCIFVFKQTHETIEKNLNPPLALSLSTFFFPIFSLSCIHLFLWPQSRMVYLLVIRCSLANQVSEHTAHTLCYDYNEMFTINLNSNSQIYW